LEDVTWAIEKDQTKDCVHNWTYYCEDVNSPHVIYRFNTNASHVVIENRSE
jgi:hypothetical protein